MHYERICRETNQKYLFKKFQILRLEIGKWQQLFICLKIIEMMKNKNK